MRRRNVLGVGVTATDYAEVCEAVRQAAVGKRSLTVSALAVHGVMTGALDPVHRLRLNALDVVVPDGQPVRWALNALYDDGLTERVAGPNLMLHVCAMAEAQGLAVGLYGSKPDVLADLSRNLTAAYPRLRIAASMPSRFRRVDPAEQEELAAQITAAGVDILFVGLGCPRQEVWLFENKLRLLMPTLAVGAAFDFHALHVPKAPQWMQDRGLEWVFRLRHEPRRLWRRYLLLNPLYLLMLAAQKLRLWRFGVDEKAGPIGYEGYA